MKKLDINWISISIYDLKAEYSSFARIRLLVDLADEVCIYKWYHRGGIYKHALKQSISIENQKNFGNRPKILGVACFLRPSLEYFHILSLSTCTIMRLLSIFTTLSTYVQSLIQI